MQAFRITKAKYAAGAFSGEGARIAGGRWNSPGRLVVYTGETCAGSMMEILVNMLDPSLLYLAYVYSKVTIPDDIIETFPLNDLPADWRTPEHSACKRIGDEWLHKAQTAALRVPSATVTGECNILLNPIHPDFQKIEISDFLPLAFDPRLEKCWPGQEER